MKVWIDQDLCTGAGTCADIAPDVFVMVDGLAHVRNGSSVSSRGIRIARGTEAVAVTDGLEEAVFEAAYDCPGDCIFVDL